MLRRAVLTCCVLAAGCAGQAAPPPAPGPLVSGRYDVMYRVAMPDPASHLYELQLEIGGVDVDTLKLQLPVWSPGRYARMDFARNVRDFAAEADGRPLAWDKENGSLWRVPTGGARRVKVRYRVFANDLSGTFSVLDTLHANWNGASLFMYVVGHKPDPVRLVVTPPAGWHVINGASLALDQLEFTFPTYDHLVDTPTEVAPSIDVDTFRVDGRLIRVAVHHNGGRALMNQGRTTAIDQGRTTAIDQGRTTAIDQSAALTDQGATSINQGAVAIDQGAVAIDQGAALINQGPTTRRRFLNDIRRIVETQNRVIAPPPLETYTFLFNIGFPGGDGMEHLTSTQVINATPWADADTVLPGLATASHEYFHTWNVKRIRPAALGPFDYTREQYQPSLWVAEGWTQYYGEMTLHRAGIVDTARLYRMLAAMIRYTSETPGRTELSARMASFHAPLWDGGAAPMETDRQNAFISYYTKGAALAMLLDLKIRAGTGGGRSLDDVLRLLKERTWDAPSTSYYLQGRGYTEDDVERAASDVFGADLHEWFERYVGGVDELPWRETLTPAGLTLSVQEVDGRREYTLGEAPDATPEQVRVREGWLKGSCAEC